MTEGNPALARRCLATAMGAVLAPASLVPVTASAAPSAYPKPVRLAAKKYPTFHGGYRTAAGFQSFTHVAAAAYPALARRVEYDSSWQKTQNPNAGSTLEALCITANAASGCRTEPNSAKPRFLLMAQIHAREITTSELAWRFITALVDGYDVNADLTALLDSTEVWVVPQVNPDGIQWVESGFTGPTIGDSAFHRKNRDNSNETTPCANNGDSQPSIDLNRNWNSYWGGAGTSADPCNLAYRGPRAASEPEVSQLASLIGELFPDQRGPALTDAAPATTKGAMITLHTYSNFVRRATGGRSRPPGCSTAERVAGAGAPARHQHQRRRQHHERQPGTEYQPEPAQIAVPVPRPREVQRRDATALDDQRPPQPPLAIGRHRRRLGGRLAHGGQQREPADGHGRHRHDGHREEPGEEEDDQQLSSDDRLQRPDQPDADQLLGDHRDAPPHAAHPGPPPRIGQARRLAC
ncbi:M14 family zinc carboxypeptidase [Allokutzneria sp. NRRL B-24872]|uniref:M14 family zinc carboxypeptidase n=1 Tax=Allokutzneria sp. NRRL B-24872 TaxID=1137961 RepID=UPI0011788F5D|nr:M14 family zinc carboxypeptidase [Allokutzneria sp. NRRL B-24872]